MGTESNKQVVRRFFDDLWNKRQLKLAEELFASDCVTHQLRSGEPVTTTPRSPEDLREHVSGWVSAFPDLEVKIEHMLAEGDLVFTNTVLVGTHRGSWAGVPPTGKRAEVRFMVVHRVIDGKIREDWVLVETLGFLQQLGIAPPTPEMLARAAQK
jgi:steroid delta-isomerase-like uncharacterized protein